MSASQLTTDKAFITPWTGSPLDEPEDLFPHLVVAAWFPEIGRVGQSMCIDRPCFFGRGEPGPLPRADLGEQRPGMTLFQEPLENPALSRRQLLLEPADDGYLHVENAGHLELHHNGRLTRSCTARSGDTLLLGDVGLLLVESRPRQLRALRSHPAAAFAFGAADPFGMVGESAAAWALRDALAAAGAADAHVVLWGETGVGKEMAAHAVHGHSPRRRGPFRARNAATVPGTLIDVELFGCAANFPNAGSPARPGLIAEAHGGYLFLDEIGELSGGYQAHVLRVMDCGGYYHRLGDATERSSDVRFLCATNRALTTLKHDLLARFSFHIIVSPLRERRSDIPLLIRHHLADRVRNLPELMAPFCRTGTVLVEPRLVEALLRFRYPENTRQLQRLLEIAIASSRGSFLGLTREVERELETPTASVTETSEAPEPVEDTVDIESYTREQIEAALATAGSVSGAADLLRVSRYALYRYIRRHGIERSRG